MTLRRQLTATAKKILVFSEGGRLFGGPAIISEPPPGSFTVLNIYVDQDGNLKIEYSDIPVED